MRWSAAAAGTMGLERQYEVAWCGSLTFVVLMAIELLIVNIDHARLIITGHNLHQQQQPVHVHITRDEYDAFCRPLSLMDERAERQSNCIALTPQKQLTPPPLCSPSHQFESQPRQHRFFLSSPLSHRDTVAFCLRARRGEMCSRLCTATSWYRRWCPQHYVAVTAAHVSRSSFRRCTLIYLYTVSVKISLMTFVSRSRT